MNSEAQLSPHREGSGPRKASAQRVLRMLDSAMGSTVSGLLKDPDVIEIRCNTDGKIFADWFDRPSSWTGHTLAPESATQVICIVADAVDQTGWCPRCFGALHVNANACDEIGKCSADR